MDSMGHIYGGKDVLDEDKARLDGFLRGRAEADREEHDRLVAELAAEKEKAKRDAD